MKILLINDSPLPPGTSRIFPIQIALLASALIENGHEVSAVDMLEPGDPEKKLETFLAQGPYDMIGVSYRNLPLAYWMVGFKSLHTLLKRLRPYTPMLVVGGAAFSLFREIIFKNLFMADAGVIGEGESAIVEIANNPNNYRNVPGVIYWQGKEMVSNPRSFVPGEKLSQLREVPGIVWQGYSSYAVQTYRGCIKNCTFCTTPYLRGNTVRLREIDSVLEDLHFLANKGVKEIIFIDSKFNLLKERSEQLMKELIKADLGIAWNAFLRPSKELKEDYLDMAERAGCKCWEMDIGSGDKRWLKLLHGDIDIDTVKYTTRLTSNRKAQTQYYFTYYLPGETFRQELGTLKLLYYIHAQGVPWSKIMIYPYFPYPHLGLENGKPSVIHEGKLFHVKRTFAYMAKPATVQGALMAAFMANEKRRKNDRKSQ